jgi:hypothetical protein
LDVTVRNRVIEVTTISLIFKNTTDEIYITKITLDKLIRSTLRELWILKVNTTNPISFRLQSLDHVRSNETTSTKDKCLLYILTHLNSNETFTYYLLYKKSRVYATLLLKVFTCTPLALYPEARNRAGVTHPHHLLLG